MMSSVLAITLVLKSTLFPGRSLKMMLFKHSLSKKDASSNKRLKIYAQPGFNDCASYFLPL